MDARLIFWSAALLNMAALLAFALHGMRAARRRQIAQHRRAMLRAAALCGAFLLAYLIKVAALGGENLADWSAAARVLLWVHEGFIALMLAAGCTAGFLARRFRLGAGAGVVPTLRDSYRHRMAGRVAVGAACCAFATACAVLAGMFARAAG